MPRSGLHLAPFWNGFERHGRDARPIDFESDLIAAGHAVSDFVLLTGITVLPRSAAAKIPAKSWRPPFGKSLLERFLARKTGRARRQSVQIRAP
jgi:hypothetical protein